ncbi:glycosyltransferase [uncultured Thiohalocapsa sp.]|uniref:glycosyltransferase family 2 protein n=1 Tax=uncultured Thiohalocapsa sp. TaxID=768990 RepID=UPI0025FBA96B|nr:glycosyltransferase [uncultured Thiohalocapsa sp.]
MNDKPSVSIIMPTHNANTGFLHAAITSCLEQTHRGWELIIVDDGSTNESPAVIAEYVASDERIRCLRHPAKRRLPAALNSGIAQARGAFLTWLSDDDLFRPRALECLLDFLSSHPDIDIVYSDYSLLYADGSVGERVRVGQPEELGIRKPVGICYLARYHAFASTGFSEEFFLAEDLDFWIRAFMRFRLAPVHCDLAFYRQHAQTLTNTQSRAKILAVHQRILDRHLPRMWWLDREGKTHAYLRLGKGFFASGAPLPAMAAISRALCFGPLVFAKTIGDIFAARLGLGTGSAGIR